MECFARFREASSLQNDIYDNRADGNVPTRTKSSAAVSTRLLQLNINIQVDVTSGEIGQCESLNRQRHSLFVLGCS